jgi:glycosyltransferase involved in cell wall biosynthesis
VSESLRQHAIALGIEPDKIRVVANGVDVDKFYPMDRGEARRRLGIAADARVLVSVGALVVRKGFNHVIDVLPELIETNPDLHYLIIGGGSAEGDIQTELEQQVTRLGLDSRVHFLGTMPPTELKWPLSAADLFVLATSNEGWANVFLEAMSCGLPVIATDVGGNAEVVCRPELGTIVPYNDQPALREALQAALSQSWDRELIRAYAEENAWDTRITHLTEELTALASGNTQADGTTAKIDVEAGLK